MNESSLTILSALILLLPLAGAVCAGALGPKYLKGQSHWPVILGVGGAAIASFALLAQVIGGGEDPSILIELYQWFSGATGVWFNVEVLIDPLTAVMLTTVTFISTLVVIYSKEYMRHDKHPERGYERFFAYLGLFVFSMCILVLGGNFLLLYLGWEAVGLCSYLLIGFYYQKPSAAAAAKKAFLVNRIGDFGFGLGILLIYITFGCLDYETVFEAARLGLHGDAAALAGLLDMGLTQATELTHTISDRLPIIALLLLCGAVGKSAQLPLYVWLPDAMEGPSPVSALIHAATMVTAGIYMMVRCGVIFTASDGVMMFIAILGAATALFAATIALVQTDMKRILAYSTISQLGYMFLGVGALAAGSAVFHLMTHAFFKALLFLGAGSVMHAMGGVIDVRRFGGLKRVLPWTYLTMLIGSAALAGFPLLAGFWSKDEIVHAAFGRHTMLGVVALLTALLTAFYTFRMIFLAFWGEERLPEGVVAHESGGWILLPLGILAVGAIGAGYFGVHIKGGGFLGFLEPHGALHTFLEPVTAPFAQHAVKASHSVSDGHGIWAAIWHHRLMYGSALLAIVGIAAAFVCYVQRPWLPQVVRATFPKAHAVLLNKYYVDEAYQAIIVAPLRRLGMFCFRADEFFIDGVVWTITVIPRLFGQMWRTLQTGALQGYGLGMAAGLAVIIA
ncbi:MAG: NADH-quinone oxidoreductase subunit L, partial [Planctomycetes bacterium]|nr:NADH-quinone oxidoreductase subunit L [Planctomycetota bacterium]